MVYSRYNYNIHWVFKPTNITFGGTILQLDDDNPQVIGSKTPTH